MALTAHQRDLVERLRSTLDARAGTYRALNGATNVADYLGRGTTAEDEETLTEPLLRELLQRLLGFPPDGYFEQLSRLGSKPDFTPVDLVAHRFVLDAKSTAQRDLDAHEPQIRRYVDQRRLDYGVLFNLREMRVYERGLRRAVADLSFPLLPLWQLARGEALPTSEVERLERFFDVFRHRTLDQEAKVRRVRQAPAWREVASAGDPLRVDIDYLVDRLRRLSRELADDAAARQDDLERHLTFNPARADALVAELRTLALDLAPGSDPEELPASVDGFRSSAGLPGRVWEQYLLRVAQLALTRILLYRSWEDAGFVEERLYDGGFGRLYDRLDRDVQRVLREAFDAGRGRYRWLFDADNNYDWYRPRDEALIEVLYALSPVPLGRLDADVLGGLYESYVDEIDRDRLGQFYTPRSVVRFMLDRAGFEGPEGVFALEGDRRSPRALLDFATGSGGFLVESARRIVDAVIDGGRADVDEGLAAIVRGLHGSEISPFPYYLTEVNLLLQVSRLLGRLRELGAEAPPFVLGVVHNDTLAARSGADESFGGLEPAERADRAALERDERFSLVPLDAEKGAAWERMRNPGFDLVVGNPPYVSETGNKILFERLRRMPGWKGTYRGKGDLLYYFLLLAAERLAPGGRLAVITPAGWMNAGEAEWLRERLAALLTIDELFLFGSHRLFAPERSTRRDFRHAPTPTVESLIMVATRAPAPADHEVRVTVLEDERAAARALAGDDAATLPDREALLDEMARRSEARGGRRGGIFVHSVPQRRLRADVPWPVKFGARHIATQVVEHLDRQVAAGAPYELLERRWEVLRGIETGADAYTKRIEKRLRPSERDRLAANGCRLGERVLELSPGVESRPPWLGHEELLARSPESRALLYGAIDSDDYGHLVWIDRQDQVAQAILDVLEPWKPLLETRAEIARNPGRRWFETAWARDKPALRGPKVMALYRTDRGRFALDEQGDWQPSNKATLCTPKEQGLSVAYLCGLLNSELLDLWYAVRGKTPWHVRRNYEPKPMRRIPYRHADASEAAPLEAVVRAIADNRRSLLPHRDAFAGLGATVKDPWRTTAPPPSEGVLLRGLEAAQRRSLRIDPTLTLSVSADPVGRAEWDGSRLTFVYKRARTGEVTGSPHLLTLLARLLHGRTGLRREDVERIELPGDPDAFSALVEDRQATVQRLLDEGRRLVEEAERLVCQLYDVPSELEEAVVAHAAQRALETE
ncbi:MAG: N-6 DNA methylase, partial [Solirubrobacteraceae bacterium]